MGISFPMGLDSPNHTKSGPSGTCLFLREVIRLLDGNGKFETSGKSPASVHHIAAIGSHDAREEVGDLEPTHPP
jgi:hypothetical protein